MVRLGFIMFENRLVPKATVEVKKFLPIISMNTARSVVQLAMAKKALSAIADGNL